MKAQDRIVDVVRRLAFPALHRAGLIEGCCAPGPSGGAFKFPALHRAGLIEGMRPALGGREGRSFRPFTGPASLKADQAAAGRGGRQLSFRPFTGPASLKDELRDGVGDGLPLFPALHRAGLIEGHEAAMVAARTTGFPALHRAGLIEGSVHVSTSGESASVSGPSQGRPH